MNTGFIPSIEKAIEHLQDKGNQLSDLIKDLADQTNTYLHNSDYETAKTTLTVLCDRRKELRMVQGLIALISPRN